MSERRQKSTDDPVAMRVTCLVLTAAFIALFLLLPLITVFARALASGISVALDSVTTSDSLAAIRLTMIVALVSVPLNTFFGICAAWAITKYEFRGKILLTSLIDLPFSVSPVVAGLAYVLIFGMQGWLGPILRHWNIKIIFAPPGIILATLFVSIPFVARELIPLMADQGQDEEAAAVTLGAGGLQIFLRVTLPNIKWGLIYGVLLCNARVMGEFGAVAVVSGHIRGLTDTLPVHVQALYDDYEFVGAFSAASLLALLALLTLIVKSVLEWRYADEITTIYRR